MTIERKVLVITRHGVRPDPGADSITSESIVRLYEKTGGPLREYDVEQEGVLLEHSGKERTIYTGKAIIAGALGLQPAPRSHRDIDAISFNGTDIREIKRLGYGHIEFNWDELVADGDPNSAEYLSRWLADPNATTYSGVKITSFNEVIQEGRDTLLNTLDSLVNSKRKLGVIATHGAIAESLVIAAVNSARKSPVRNFDEIGGIFSMEDYATIVVDPTQEDSTNCGGYTGILQRNGQEYPVDLARRENEK